MTTTDILLSDSQKIQLKNAWTKERDKDALVALQNDKILRERKITRDRVEAVAVQIDHFQKESERWKLEQERKERGQLDVVLLVRGVCNYIVGQIDSFHKKTR